jgi:hypothetical protein
MDCRRIVWALIFMLTCASDVSAAHSHLTASLQISADPVQPEGAPVLLMLTVRNTGREPISYWCGGPGEYPDAGDFFANLKRVDAIRFYWPEPKVFSNGQSRDGAGRLLEVPPGRTLQFPVAFEPVPQGIYIITVEGNADGRMQNGAIRFVTWPAMQSNDAVTVEIRADQKLATARDTQTIAKVRANDPFAKYVASNWPRKQVREALIDDLMGEDAVKADRAIEGLWGDGEPPKADAPIVVRAIVKHLKPPEATTDVGLMTRLVEASKASKSPDATAAIALLATSRANGRIQDMANDRLVAIKAGDGRGNIGEFSDTEIPKDDSVVVDALAGLARSADPEQRKLAFNLLGFHPNNPVAEQVLRAGLNDQDLEVYAAADRNLDNIRRFHLAHAAPVTTAP